MARPVELYTTSGCPYSAAAREDLEWRGVDFVEEGKPVQVGWMGQGCFV
jgi:glutaredoxin 3